MPILSIDGEINATNNLTAINKARIVYTLAYFIGVIMEDRSGFFFRVGKDDTLLQNIMGYFQQQGRGKLSRALRDGLRLFWDLSQQRTDVLIELFPFVTDAICPPQSNNDDVLREIEALRHELRQQQTTSHDIPDTRNYGIPAMKHAGAGIGSTLGVGKKMALPVFEDDDDLPTIAITQSANPKNNGGNLLGGILAL